MSDPGEPLGSLTLGAFVRRSGVVAGWAIAVMSASQLIGGCLLREAMQPITAEIQRQVAAETEARVAADSRIVTSLRELSSDRLAILALLEHPPGAERARQLRQIRREWESRGD